MARCGSCVSCVACVRMGLRAANYLLLTLGFAMTIYAVYMYAEFRKQAFHGGGIAPTTAPHARSISPTTAAGVPFEPDHPYSAFPPPEHNRHSTPDSDELLGGNLQWSNETVDVEFDVSKFWFVYGFCAAGVFTTLTASTGLVAAGTENGCLLSCYTYELVLMLFGQAALALALFTDTGMDKIPDDVTGNEKEVLRFLRQHFDIAKWVALGVLILEVLSVLLACALKACKPADDSDDDDDDSINQPFLPPSRRVGEEGPELGRTSSGAGGSGRTFSHKLQSTSALKYHQWRERMREKYGLDTDRFTYGDPESHPRSDDQSHSSGASTQQGRSAASACIIA
eukprot:CAMPEP_0114305432 /NCGR_PEP_ID=MMETSP0059-20121206/16339_1 /TAXON_ID=36894 /ORGANISM="Pyramimonas parkeae, Strain CCMP726" /LENGTH=339 /DNA_ID=CAMNT_0001428641 /DNA_START=47 /DNA_END=1066 /DNA_ORIENTATION=-